MSDIDEGARELRISTETDAAGGVRVTVRDTGPGLDATSVDRLFEAFYTTKPGGMGMGLSICRSIIEAHGADCGPARMSLGGPCFSSPCLHKWPRPFMPSTPAQCRWCELAGPESETNASAERRMSPM